MDANLITIVVVGGLAVFLLLAIIYAMTKKPTKKAIKETPVVEKTEEKKPEPQVIPEVKEVKPVEQPAEPKVTQPEPTPTVSDTSQPASVAIVAETKAEPKIEKEIEPEPVKTEVAPEPVVIEKAAVTKTKTGEADRSLKVSRIEGIGPEYAKKLGDIGIKTTGELLEAGKTKAGREKLASDVGISQKLILEWVNLADLFRITGIGEEYSDLLEEAGVDTVVELARRKPENLAAKLKEINEEKKLVRRVPNQAKVENWVKQAKELPRKVEY